MYTFTKRELEVMEILWQSKKGMVASDIVKAKAGLSINTVQAVLRKLLAKKVITVGDIVYSGTVLSRSYEPLISKRNYELQKLKENFQNITVDDISTSNFVAALLDQEVDPEKALREINELENMLQSYKQKYSK